MGGLSGALAIDGAPLDYSRFIAGCAAAPFRGAAALQIGETAALAALGEAQLATGSRNPCGWRASDGPAIAFHGVLHNPADLRRALGIDASDAGDADLVLAAYGRWRERCVDHLLGDFAFAVWDAQARTLFCARDPLGMRPLYYSMSGRVFVAASDLLQLLAGGGVPALNEGMVAEYLADAITSAHETVYADIYRLPPGEWLSIRADGEMVRRRFWNPAELPDEPPRTDDEYAAEFRAIFLEAVRSRLPKGERPGIYLSGGIDSSAVAGAVSLVAAERPMAFSLAFGDDPERHELRYIDDVVHRFALESVVTRAAEPVTRPAPPYNRDPHDHLRDFVASDWRAGIRARGIRVVLSGRGGDDAFFGSQYHYASLLRRGRIAAMMRQWRADAVVLESPASMIDLVRFGLWPLMPSFARKAAAPAARSFIGERVVPPWIDPSFARRVSLADRLRPRPTRQRAATPSRDEIIRATYELGWKCMGREIAEREAAEFGLDERHPFLDRRVVEFALRVPDDQRWRGQITRYVVRQGLHDVLPPSIMTRTSSGDGASRVILGIDGMGGRRLLERSHLAEAGWVRPGVLLTKYDRMRRAFEIDGRVRSGDAMPLWVICGTELWFRRLHA